MQIKIRIRMKMIINKVRKWYRNRIPLRRRIEILKINGGIISNKIYRIKNNSNNFKISSQTIQIQAKMTKFNSKSSNKR